MLKKLIYNYCFFNFQIINLLKKKKTMQDERVKYNDSDLQEFKK